jgi:plastocyanin
MRNVLTVLAGVSSVLIVTAGCGTDTPPAKALPRIVSTEAAAGKSVRLTAAGPIPNRLIAGPGDTVAWHNEAATPQTVRLLDGTKPSGPIPPGGWYSHFFSTSGTFAYRLGTAKTPAGVIEINLPATPQPVRPAQRPPRSTAPSAG